MIGNGTDPMQPGTQYVRVINVGRRFGRGFNRLEKANPFQRVMAWILAIVVGIPLALILGLLLLVAIGVTLAFGIFSWLLGRPVARPMYGSLSRPAEEPAGPTAPGRENVKVVTNER